MKSRIKKYIKNIPAPSRLKRTVRHITRLPELHGAIETRISVLEKKTGLFVDNPHLDNFYAQFEDRFRGSETDIRSRLEEYIPDFTSKAPVDFSKNPVLDIGSGRGEFLEVMKYAGVPASGIDINQDMVQRSLNKGLQVIQGDAVKHLLSSGKKKYGAITGFHIVEHIPFDNLLELFNACYTGLEKNGFVLFETPNPENILVGTSNFYMDPSHLNPIPPALLKFSLESVGFKDVEIRYLHPLPVPNDAEGLPDSLKQRLYGPADYSVIGFKSI